MSDELQVVLVFERPGGARYALRSDGTVVQETADGSKVWTKRLSPEGFRRWALGRGLIEVKEVKG
jgi:hypothetical protein